jgi:hypothetical protein
MVINNKTKRDPVADKQQTRAKDRRSKEFQLPRDALKRKAN